MKITLTGHERYHMSISPAEALVFVNCMKETIKHIPSREYQTRMGAKLADIRHVIALLEGVLK